MDCERDLVDGAPEADVALDPIAELAARLAAVGHAREHHLWEAVRVLPCLSHVRDTQPFRESFRSAMERDDFAGALDVIATGAFPPRRLASIACHGRLWAARFVLKAPRRLEVVNRHGDRTAAILGALVCMDARSRARQPASL